VEGLHVPQETLGGAETSSFATAFVAYEVVTVRAKLAQSAVGTYTAPATFPASTALLIMNAYTISTTGLAPEALNTMGT